MIVKIFFLILIVCGFLFNGRSFGQNSFPKGSKKPMIERVDDKNKGTKHQRMKLKKRSAKKAKKEA